MENSNNKENKENKEKKDEQQHTTQSTGAETSNETDKKDEKPSKDDPSSTPTEEFSLYRYIKHNFKNIVIAALLICLFAFYAWSHFSIKKTERVMTREYDELYAAAKAFSYKKDTMYLKNLALSFSYAMLSERLQGNTGTMNEYAKGLLHNDKNITDIIIANEDGQVISSTNKKYEDINLRDFLLINLVRLNNITIKADKEEGRVLVFAPLKALNKSWGYLVFRYELVPFVYEK